jgi:predicted transcriptional regulator
MESFKQEALASWTAYQETGRHLTGQEVRDWLNSWGTDKETKIPKCHE